MSGADGPSERRLKAYAVARNSEGGILVVGIPSDGALPGGEIAENEGAAESVARHALEQSGLQLRPGEVICRTSSRVTLDSLGNWREVESTFLAAEAEGDPTGTDGKWLPLRPALIALQRSSHQAAVLSLLFGVNEEMIQKLPIWVAVGLAARCARILTPHFEAVSSEMQKDERADMLRAVAIAEEFAARGAGRLDYAAEADADAAADAIGRFEHWTDDDGAALYLDAFPAAAYAAGCAADLAAGASWANRQLVVDNAWRAIRASLTCRPVAQRIAGMVRSVSEKCAAAALDDRAACPQEFLDR